jgi:Mn2+/Fe2+ NRAMP family transporter
VTIPALLASTGYVVTGTFGWAASLWKKTWQNGGFYLILTAALVVGPGLAMLRVSPIQLMVAANALQAFLAPLPLILLLALGNSRRILGV